MSGGTVVLGTVTGVTPAPGPLGADPEAPETCGFPVPRVSSMSASSVPWSEVVTKPPMLGLAMFHSA